MKRSRIVGLAAGIAASVLAGGASAQLLAGAHKVNIEPRPEDYGGFWEQNAANCAGSLEHATDTKHIWPENPSCIYSGGFGLGVSPVGLGVNALTSFDETGLWVRSVAIRDDAGNTVVLTILDGAYYFARYRNTCDDCGFFDLAEDLGAELGIDPSGFLFASTHSHAAPDFIGGWGGVPDWYMQQVTDALREAVRQAVGKLEPAYLEGGEILARHFNSERRDTYRSAEEAGVSWFRAVAEGTGQTIATVGAYAAHPVGHGAGPVAHADYPVFFNRRVEERFGGVGLYFMTGLGNMSRSGGNTEVVGTGLADLLPEIDEGTRVTGDTVRSVQRRWNHPVTNSALLGLGGAGGFDRAFSSEPGQVTVFPKGGNRPCASASAVSVETGITAIRIGNLTITGGPGELFSNLTNTIKEKSPWVALPIALANDGLGYIMQSFEHDPVAGQGVGFVGANFFEYEDAYSIDGCFGDMVLEETLAALAGF
jgi:hypothetical protein